MQKLTDNKSEQPDWFQLLFEHTHRQGNIAGFQMIVSFFVLGFVWSKDTPWGAALIMLGVYSFCAIYPIERRPCSLFRLVHLVLLYTRLPSRYIHPSLFWMLAQRSLVLLLSG